MRRTKKVPLILITASLLFSPLQISAQNNTGNLNDGQINEFISKDSTVVTASLLPKIASFLAKPLIKAIGNIPLSSHPGYVSHLGGGDYYVNHNSLDFNQNGNGTTVIKGVLANGQDILRPYMQKNQILAGNIGITIFNSSGSKVADRSLGSGRTFDYKVPGGYSTEYNYKIHYSVHNKERWTPRMYYININPTCSGCGTNSIEPSNQLENFSIDKVTDKFIVEDQVYIMQNESIVSEDYSVLSKGLENTDISNSTKSLTMNELFTEFYDGNTGELTDQAKTLIPDTKVEINDVIEEVSYNKVERYTEFKFKSEYAELNYHSVFFKGDLSKEYKKGDSLILTFDVVKTAEIEGHIFVDLNYNLQAMQNNEYPAIDSYLN